MTLQRLNAIASGILVGGIGITFAVLLSGGFWETLETARRQTEVIGTVVGQEPTKVCRNREHVSFRSSRPGKCLRWENVSCPIVQYQPKTGQPLKLKDCYQTLSKGMQVYVLYDSETPTDASIFLEAGTTYHWRSVFFSGVLLSFPIIFVGAGISKVCEGFQRREEL
jgi:hypothetical protein